MVFKRYVEIGRVCLINYGADAGKLCVIVDVINQSHALIDGPTTGVLRQPLNFRRLTLTDFRIKIPHGIRTGGLKKALEKQDVISKFNESSWGKRIRQRKVKRNMSDFCRFKFMIAKKRSHIFINTSVKAMKRTK